MIIRSVLSFVFTAIIFIGCSTSVHVKKETVLSSEFGGPATVSVSGFTCSDPIIALDVQNAVIGSLLESYSVIAGGEAGVIISGDIILVNNERKISEITANVFKHGTKIDNVSVKGSETPSGSPAEMGEKIAAGIKEILSR